MKHTVIKIIIPMLCLTVCGCSMNRVDSRWRTQAMTADGADSDWPSGEPEYYDEDLQVVVRVNNTEDMLYLLVSTGSRALQRQLESGGLTVWLDPHGGKKKQIGVRLAGSPFAGGPGGDEHRGPRGGGPFMMPGGDRPDREGKKPERPSVDAMKEIDITSDGPDEFRPVSVDEARQDGVEAGFGRPDRRRLVYEFAIGFKVDSRLASLKPGKVLGVGIEGNASESGGPGGMPGGGGPGGGPGGGMGHFGPDGGMGGGPGGGHGGGPGGRRSETKTDPLSVWMKVRLAEKP